MPRSKAEISKKAPKNSKRGPPQESILNDESIASEDSIVADSQDVSEQEKNNIESDDGYQQDFSGEMSKLLEKFSTDMNKSIQAKRKKLEQYTQESTRSTTKKVLETNRNQSMERRKLVEHFNGQLNAMLEQGECELEEIKRAEEKIQSVTKALIQQQKHREQVRIACNHRIKALKNLGAEFCKGMGELEESHVQQYSAVHNELRKEMNLLQKKILMETQQQEMMNVRKNLRQMLS